MSDKPPPPPPGPPLPGTPPSAGPPAPGTPQSAAPSSTDTSAETDVILDEIVEDTVPLPLMAGGQVRVGKKAGLPEHRFRLAVALLLTVSILAIGLVLAVMFTGESRLESIRSIAGIVFGPLVTLLGTSFAWYFAKNTGSE